MRQDTAPAAPIKVASKEATAKELMAMETAATVASAMELESAMALAMITADGKDSGLAETLRTAAVQPRSMD